MVVRAARGVVLYNLIKYNDKRPRAALRMAPILGPAVGTLLHVALLYVFSRR